MFFMHAAYGCINSYLETLTNLHKAKPPYADDSALGLQGLQAADILKEVSSYDTVG